MSQELLIEIGLEELPALPLLAELDNIPAKWNAVLAKYRLDAPFEFHYTPRRLCLYHESFPATQATQTVEAFGPPVAIAYKNDEPTAAALSFAKKCNASLDVITTAMKEGKEVLYYAATREGEASAKFLGEMLGEFLASLVFGKSMRWGSLSEPFIRPIRWITILLGGHPVECSLYGVKSGRTTRLHRMAGKTEVKVTGWGEYRALLRAGGIILEADERRTRILSQMEELERETGMQIERDEELLDEVVAITEHPTVLVGQFDAAFLRLPPEVIITSMKANQRYFPVFRDSKLSNEFIVVSNALCEDFAKVVAGNERVLRARLSDAIFFYDNDLRTGLMPQKLESILFVDGLGSLLDKSRRESEIGQRLNRMWGLGLDEARLVRALELAKADLVSEMVYEFTELQGVMGSYYARAMGESDEVARSIAQQYLPAGEGSALPSGVFEAIVASATKFDNLMGLFSLGKIPTGSKDPFALRRAFLGLVRIALAYRLPLDLEATVSGLADLYGAFDREKLTQFMHERLVFFFEANPSVVKAVLAGGSSNLLEISERVEVMEALAASEDFRANFSTFKRVANITKEVDISGDLPVDAAHFAQDEERALFEAYRAALTHEGAKARLEALFGLRGLLEKFFDAVLVNAPEEALRTNRRNLVASVYKSFKELADIKEISL